MKRIQWGHGAKTGIVVLLGVLVVIACIIFVLRAPEAHDPNAEAISATNNLMTTSKQLKDSFGNADSNPSDAIKQYLKYMDQLTENCKTINAATAGAKVSKADQDTLILLNNSVILCKDLSDIVTESSTIYTAVLPVLTIRTTPKRFQTLPLIKPAIISSHQKKINTALGRLKAAKTGQADYTKLSIERLSELQKAAATKHDFSYLTTVKSFQQQQVADRHQYWTNYADISGLIPVLQTQLERYCQNVPSTGQTPAACK